MSVDRFTDRIRYFGSGTPGVAGGGAPTDASYVTTVAESGLSNEKVFGSIVFYPPGILASRPAASATIVGALYFATDGGGVATQGTLYRSDGVSAWELIAIDKEYADALYLVANDSITFAKMQNIATDSLIGRDTAGTGDPENILLGNGVAMDGAGSLITTPTAGVIRDTFSDTDKTITAPTTLLAQIGTLTATRTVTLPAANAYSPGAHIVIVDSSGSLTPTKIITVVRAGADTINGGTSWSIGAPYGALILGSNGINQWVAVDTSVYFDRQEFTANGTWTKPPNAMSVHLRIVGGGGSGGGGRSGADGALRCGGAGGGAGGIFDVTLDPADLSDSGETVVIAAQQTTVGAGGGTGGANGTAGSNGGNNSTFGTVVMVTAGGAFFFGAAAGGTATDQTSGGVGASVTGAVSKLNSTFSVMTSNDGGFSSASGGGIGGTSLAGALPGGGAAGGARTAANVSGAGGVGGNGAGAGITGGTAGAATGGVGGNGVSNSTTWGAGAGGGGGGAGHNNTTAGGVGGDGGFPGGGGGGGGAAISGGTAVGGNGGKGARGYCLVETMCARV